MLASVFIQEYFRIRLGDTVGLNVDSAWAAAENTNATIGTGLVFRIRFKVRETAGGDDASNNYKLQVKRNAGGFVDLDVLGGAAAPAVLANLSSQYTDADAATELLTNTTTYVNGEGLENNISSNFSLTSEELELEFCIRIMSFHDGPTQNVEDDTLEFRVVEGDGTVFGGTYVNPVITVTETAGYIGGTYPETPCKIGPYVDANGNIYVLIEPAESQNDPIMIKSTDGGDTWREKDGAGRPTTNDVEGVDIVKVTDTLHILHQEGSSVVYHRFTMSDHGSTPDEWTIIDEAVATVTSFTTQCCSLAVLADGSIRGFYVDGTSPLRVRYKTRSTGGTWGSEQTVDSEASTDFISPFCVLAESDKVYVVYKNDTDGIIYVRDLNSSSTLSGRTTVSTGIDAATNNDHVPYCPPVYYDDGGVEVIALIYQKDGTAALAELFSKYIRDGSLGSEATASDNDCERSQGGSHMIIATSTADEKTLHLIYGQNGTDDGWHAQNPDEAGWGTDVEIHDNADMHWVRANVFTHSGGNGGNKVLGYIWDNGSAGGTGRIFYDEIVLEAGGAGQPTQVRTHGIPTSSGYRDRPGRWN